MVALCSFLALLGWFEDPTLAEALFNIYKPYSACQHGLVTFE